MMRVFEAEPQLQNYRLNKIGIRNQLLYVSPNRFDAIQVWSLHSFIPNSWHCIVDIPVIELLHTSYTLSPTENFVYILAVALFDCDVPRIAILKINTDNGEVKDYSLDFAAGDEYENKVFLENVVICCSDKQLFMYDRSIVMGPIPFWIVVLLEDTMTFIITSDTILAEEPEGRSSRFPIVLNGDKRKVLKIMDDNAFSVYNGKERKWDKYIPSLNSNLNMDELGTRGISETYGRSGHRVGAVESPLSIFSGDESCIAKVYRNGVHSFYFIEFNDLTKEYRAIPASRCRLPEYIEQKYYAGIAFVPICPSSLRELAFFAIQQQYSTNSDGRWSGGISEQNIKDIICCKSKNPML